MEKRVSLVKKANVIERYTPEQIEEIFKCTDDPFYFIENYCKVIDKKGKEILFKLYPYQRRLLESVHENQYSVALFARQMGKCFFVTEQINKNDKEVKIGSLIWDHLTLKQKLVTKLEIWKINLLLKIHKEDVRIAK